VAHTAKGLAKLLEQLSPHGEVLDVCYEAGPCGYGLYRELVARGHRCTVVAPALIPRQAGVRLKTDRRDALLLARLHRAGELTAAQQLVLQEYVEAVQEAQRRVAGLEEQLRQVLATWAWRPVVEGLMALRGVSLIAAVTIVAELGDLSRFDSPRELMGYLGLVPSEHSSGGSRRQGGITRTGNGHVRRVLVEAAWNYRFPARKTRIIEQRAERTAVAVQAIAWAAQKRLCARYQALLQAGKQKPQVTTAVARELAGFLWAIACEVLGKAHGSKALA
jgi:transposase